MSRPPIVHHPAYRAPLPQGHRFPMGKFARLFACLEERELATGTNTFRPEPASPEWLLLAHESAWVTAVLEQRVDQAAERRLGLPVTAPVALRARAATAGTVLAARLALQHGLALNTAGGSHHAFPGFGSGFCVFNDVGVAINVLLAENGVQRVLVIDLDVHQGDGTAAMLGHDSRVTTVSVHCRANFPARKQQSSVDIALDEGVGDAGYLALLDDLLPGLLRRARPDLVFYNAGVDPHAADRLGRLNLSDRGLAERDRRVIELCREARLPLACVIGGGYDPDIDALAARHAILFETAASLRGW